MSKYTCRNKNPSFCAGCTTRPRPDLCQFQGWDSPRAFMIFTDDGMILEDLIFEGCLRKKESTGKIVQFRKSRKDYPDGFQIMIADHKIEMIVSYPREEEE